MPDGWAMRSLGDQEKNLQLAGLQLRPSLLSAETEEDTASLRTEGHKIDVEGSAVMLSMDKHARINDVLVLVSSLDMSLTEDELTRAILPLSEEA
jgi:hypothetical protein